jgi:hypothetical protein
MVKPTASKKIDLAIALAMAVVAAIQNGPMSTDVSALLEMNRFGPERAKRIDRDWLDDQRDGHPMERIGGRRFWEL